MAYTAALISAIVYGGSYVWTDQALYSIEYTEHLSYDPDQIP